MSQILGRMEVMSVKKQLLGEGNIVSLISMFQPLLLLKICSGEHQLRHRAP